ncbi:MAG TPA: ABC transporter permease, partial [Firmicutes bacterium]|nr:ABC transporter permease [Bacillota bacterium]
MIVFKTYLRVVKKCLVPIILYTSMLILFSSINTNNSNNELSFTAEKPDILIINNDKDSKISKP